MSKYRLTATVTVSLYTDVEAETLEDAIEIAEDRNIEKSEWGNEALSKYVWVNEDYDGEVMDIRKD